MTARPTAGRLYFEPPEQDLQVNFPPLNANRPYRCYPLPFNQIDGYHFGEKAEFAGIHYCLTFMMTYNIALLDDHRVVLESFANLLATFDRFRVIGMAFDRPSLLNILDQNPVDVLVTDLLMPTLNGAEFIPMIKNRYPNLAVLVLSGSYDPALVRQVMQAGADGYMTKTADKAELFDAILAVAAGRRHIDSRVFSMDEAVLAPVLSTLPASTSLTERENQVASLILDELSSMEIASRLFISFNTVETHRKRIYQKLGVTTALGLMKYLLKRGLMKT
jgi:DNA-binding NarL/FixJ family response regulator